MTAAKPRRRSPGRPEPSWRIRAIRRDPLDPRLLARLFIQMALERGNGQHTETGTRTDEPIAHPDPDGQSAPLVSQAGTVS
jgi:hypothetical protein